MSIEIQIALSEECRAVAERNFVGEGARDRFNSAIKEAINKARKRLTKQQTKGD